MRSPRVRRAAFLSFLLWSGVAFSDPDPPTPSPETAYLQGSLIHLQLENSSSGADFVFGPWRIGSQLTDSRPRDARHNLYILNPGHTNHIPGRDDYDCDLIIGFAPDSGAVVEWDVIWAVVIDPQLDAAIRSERDLLVLAQQSFQPADVFEFDDVPGRAVLRELGFSTTEQLARLRKRDGRLPRILLIPSHRAIRMAVVRP